MRKKAKTKKKATGTKKKAVEKKVAKKKATKKKVAKKPSAKKKPIKKTQARKKPAKKSKVTRKKTKKVASKPKKKTPKGKKLTTRKPVKKTAKKPAKLTPKKKVKSVTPKQIEPVTTTIAETQPMPAEPVGKIEHYYSYLGVAVVSLIQGGLQIGDHIKISGHTTNFEQRVDSMEVDHQPVQWAQPGQIFGLKVKDHARENDIVYRLPSGT